MNALEIAKRIVELPRGKTFEASGLEIDYLAQAVVDAEQIIRDARNVTRGRGPMFPKIGQRSDEWLSKHAGEKK